MPYLGFLILGGVLGTLSRYYLSLGVQSMIGSSLPCGTLVVNLTGCFLMGIVLAMMENTSISSIIPSGLTPGIQLLVITGFLGAFTTFSTFELESFFLIRNGSWGGMLLYMGLSLAGGLFMLWAGYVLGRLGLSQPS